MTEAEWLACRDPGPMIAYLWLPRPATPQNARRLRLLGCACVRAVWPLLRQAGSREAVEVAERYADGSATDDDLWAARRLALAGFAAERAGEGYSPHWLAADAASHLTVRSYNGGRFPSYARASVAAAHAWAANHVQTGQGLDQAAQVQARQAGHADWLRDIFGNPFRPVTLSPEWRTDTAVALARTMYESRDFGAMPILADALQDAGCDSDTLLNHLRDANATHVRGCWALNLVLGKE